ncbi:MAG: trehalose-6-phosphate synthase [Candidatus Sericytochromatia bacterium]|nr:trehalose-6-phosphate synthase [Candidatus Sericytochromatia bacterium]
MSQAARHLRPGGPDPCITATRRQLAAAREVCRDKLGNHQVWLASNRGPVELFQDNEQTLQRKGHGGMASALRAFGQVTSVCWVACAMNSTERQAMRARGGNLRISGPDSCIDLSLVTPKQEEYARYYDVIANGVLWLLQHQANHAPTHPTFDDTLWKAWQWGYERVNQLFSEHLRASVRRSGQPPVFLVQDYHLYLLPGLLRDGFPDAPILHFTHIPWPGPDTWRQLPRDIRNAIFSQMLKSDLIGFHATRYIKNFLHGCEELLGLPVDRKQNLVKAHGRWVRVRAYPISVDPCALKRHAESPEVLQAQAQLCRHEREKLIVVIARTDPSKNLVRTLRGYDYFLTQSPEWRTRVRLVALLPLSRQSNELYRDYGEELCKMAERINNTWKQGTWRPLHLWLEHNYEQGIALLKNYDVLVVNSLSDGMNLVAKEGPVINACSGALILSENTGAYQELKDACHVINPFDIQGFCEALNEALSEHPAKRQWAQDRQRQTISESTIYRWIQEQLDELLTPVTRECRALQPSRDPFRSRSD